MDMSMGMGMGGMGSPFADGPEWQEGVVDEWSNRGFGFVKLKGDGKRAYVHVSALRPAREELQIGETVSVITAPDDQNPGKLKVVQLKSGAPMVEQGVVEQWRKESGFGFLNMEDGRRVYIHASVFRDHGIRDLEVGARLKVATKPDERNPGKWCVAEIKSGFGGFGEDTSSQMFAATVTEWDQRGFGFAVAGAGDSERRVYIHHSSFGSGDLQVGERVSVTIGQDQRNPTKHCA